MNKDKNTKKKPEAAGGAEVQGAEVGAGRGGTQNKLKNKKSLSPNAEGQDETQDPGAEAAGEQLIQEAEVGAGGGRKPKINRKIKNLPPPKLDAMTRP